ncbi:hypothetical protein JQK87_06715 [Streptomyces sp. G44]|uniref:hypothetical protein n=1 Tax=Streptomyces sp. G44 TaxID=2807632 RepID=UPI0019617792|nr:hypothetical protein [Streptomyces sp. G44]MBM7168107.1 hypothetical protein [Streptomyces sp. G44]
MLKVTSMPGGDWSGPALCLRRWPPPSVKGCAMATGTLTINGTTYNNPNGCYNIDGGSAEITYDTDATITVYSSRDGQGDSVSRVSGGGRGTINQSPAGSVVVE